MVAVDHNRSVLFSSLMVVVFILVGQLFKEPLSSSRPGTLLGGGIGCLVFIYTLTAISNIKMSNFGEQSKSGLSEVFGALLFGIITSASIHRVSATICILFSVGSIVFLSGIAQSRYSPASHAQQVSTSKKRK